MLRCNDCRPLIPDLLYGLLDAPEAAAVAAHLDTCPGCAAARDEAARVQGLIAAAARGTFPAVRFEPPVARPRTPTPAPAVRRPAVVPFPPPDSRAATPAARPAPRGDSATSRAARWLPWAVAAAVLVAVPGTAVPVLDLIRKAEAARGEADRSVAAAAAAVDALKAAEEEAERPRTVARANLAAAQQAHDALLARWVADEKAVARAAEARKPAWDVRKPAAVQPGAPNEFLLSVRDPGTGPAGRLVAEVRDQTDAVIHSQPINIEQSPDHTVRLPASVWEKLTPLSELFLTVTRVDEKTGAKTDLPDRVRLLGPVYATVLTTDKAAYRPGETVYFRSLTLDRVSLTPPAREQVLRYELRGPGGPVRGAPPVEGSTDLVRVAGGGVGPVAGPDGKPVRGVGCGAFPLPPDASDGDYTLVLRELPAGGPPAVPFEVTRTVKVRAGAAEAYRKRAGFSAESYAPGDTVEAWVELRRGGEPVAGVGVTAVALADGTALRVEPVGAPVTGENGRAVFRFALPRDLDRADVRLKATFDVGKDKGPAEEVADRVPVVGRRVTVEFFPEGGNLVAGVPCRVYARATTPAGHPVAVSGVVTDGRQVLARVQTPNDPAEPGANRGIAVFEFTPRLGTPAWLRLDAPAAHAPLLIPEGGVPTLPAAAAGASAVAGARTGFVLPEAKRDGVVMTVPDPVTAPGQPVRVHLRSVGGERNLVVGAYTRGRLSDTRRVTVAPGRVAEARLMAGTDPRGGVVRVTVFEEPAGDPDGPKGDLVPVAERLVFRKPGEALNLNFTANAARAGAAGFAPGSAVELAVTAADEKGNPAAAILFATAVDAAAAPGPTDRLLTTHFLLAGEVNGPDALEHADFLLTDRPGAAEALDRVLATQGWRRFAEQTPEGFARRPAVASAEHRGLLECNGQYLTADPARERDHQRVRDEYRPRYEAAVKALAAAKGELDAARATGPGDAPARREAAAQLRAEAVAAGDRADAGYSVLVGLEGDGSLRTATGEVRFGAGSVVLLPHAAGPAELDGDARGLRCRPPDPAAPEGRW